MFGIGKQANYLANPVSGGPATDTYWSNTVLLLTGDDSSYDSKINLYRPISGSDISSNSGTYKFGSSLYFNNSDTPQNGTDSYIYSSSNADFTFGTGDWTVEGWVYAKRTSGLNTIFDGRTAGADISPNLFIYNGAWATYQNGWGFNSVGSVSTNTWYHIALVRYGSNSYLYVNGSLVTSIADTRNYVAGGLRIGAGWNANDGFYGHLDDLRITKGVARYTAGFTAPTEAYPTSGSTASYSADYLVVSGGGGAGRNISGAGGGGGLLSGSTTINVGSTYTITVGAGGAYAASTSVRGTTGTNSSLLTSGVSVATPIGGGGGGTRTDSNSAQCQGGTGGSGGGGAGQDATYSSYAPLGGSATSGQGYAGGRGYNTGSGLTGGGGGGAGAVGTDATSTNGGNGGAGASSSITGTATYYAGGGGGGAHSSVTAAGTGGSGGGGNGAKGLANATSGTANTGGGGGGTGSNSYTPGSGGSGIAILRILTANYSGTTTGSPTVTTDGSYTVIKFTASGSYTA